jgi:hypothetical protein
MKKRKPEPGTAEYAPDKVTPAPQPKKKETGTTNRLRETCSKKRENISSSVALHSRRKMTRIPAKLLPGATIMADDNIERIPIKNIRQEPGAHELATSPDMKPYLEFIKAVMQDPDPTPELEAIRQLPLEKRYVWRIASALKWGLADCESMSVEADRRTLTPEDFAKVMDLLKFRPMQLAIVLKALVGADEMQRMMVEAIGVVKREA